jgi:hypothetical protein
MVAETDGSPCYKSTAPEEVVHVIEVFAAVRVLIMIFRLNGYTLRCMDMSWTAEKVAVMKGSNARMIKY